MCIRDSIGGMHTFTSETEKLLTRGPSRVSPLFIPMMIANIAAGNIAMAMDAQGPCLPVVCLLYTSSSEIIRSQGGWIHHLLTEDIEFTVDNALKGETIGYCEAAVLYDEQPEQFMRCV